MGGNPGQVLSIEPCSTLQAFLGLGNQLTDPSSAEAQLLCQGFHGQAAFAVRSAKRLFPAGALFEPLSQGSRHMTLWLGHFWVASDLWSRRVQHAPHEVVVAQVDLPVQRFIPKRHALPQSDQFGVQPLRSLHVFG